MGGTTGRAAGAADRAGNSDTLEHLARVGLVAYGVVHLLIAWLAVQLAWGVGGSAAQPDQSGALATLAQQPFGTVLLWVLAIGMAALAAWQAAEALRWRGGLSASGEARNKAVVTVVKAVAKAVLYVAIAVLAVRYATGGGQSGGQEQQAAAGIFGLPAGRWIVLLLGLGIVGIGGYLVHKGITKRFLKEIDLREAPPEATRLVTRLGQAGYPAKGVSFGLVGALLVWAAVTYDPADASGLDSALRSLLTVPFGQWLLTVVAVGIAAFGAYCLVRARYPERT
ncbi:protein of unknown function [Geodermatophilus pulveris]|uniref:DUF1206 domain-containing protein n=1 Tax=Geodermatophilus pulveris TaxID=1564159 RepID=A0A239I8U3_9ACTN|nr:DUF1206 domain-containing protein [Geodermatophilus pulveris]SNS90015.1 protein of unknown function [Geodermatophilus pulveris]